MDDRTWEDMQIDDEQRGWFNTPPPEIAAEWEFIGCAKCVDCVDGREVCHCENGVMEVWVKL